MTSINTSEELKRKLEFQGGSNQKIRKQSHEDSFLNETFDSEEEEHMENVKPESNQKPNDQSQQQLIHQRKKPGRKPNPASPTIRKEQNRAAQRAFRERKERHLKELENTIKTLQNSQYESDIKFHSEIQRLRSLIEQLENENLYLKYVSYNFEVAFNHFNGNEMTAKIKGAIQSRSSSVGSTASSLIGIPPSTLNSLQLPLHLQNHLTNNQLQLFQGDISDVLTSPSPPTSSALSPVSGNMSSPKSVISSPATIPESDPSLTINDDVFNQNGNGIFDIILTKMTSKPTATNIHNNSTINSNDSSIVTLFPSLTNQDIDINTTDLFNNEYFSDYPKGLYALFDLYDPLTMKNVDQLIRLGKFIGVEDITTPVKPRTRHPLTDVHKHYLSVPHDRRMDLIPCLHLRSRMIQYQDQYDLYELIELLIEKAKCHGDPLDPDAWELPNEFFTNYEILTNEHCRIKSLLYQQHGKLPPDFAVIY